MRLAIVTPASVARSNGNRTTALRWAKRLRELGASTQVLHEWRGEPADALIALHASRSAPSAERWLARRPGSPLLIGLSGTDIYGELASDSRALNALKAAAAVVALQPRACERLPAVLRSKCSAIQQSAPD